MIGHMAQWIGGLGSESAEILQSLTKVSHRFPYQTCLKESNLSFSQQSVRDHKNKRPGLDSDIEEAGYGGCGHGHKPSKTTGTSSSGKIMRMQCISNGIDGDHCGISRLCSANRTVYVQEHAIHI